MVLRRRDWLNFVSEREWHNTVTEAAALQGWTVFWTQQSGPGKGKGAHSPPGEPDLRIIRPPRVIFAELKKQDGKATPEQEEALALLAQCPGVEAYLWRPGDWDDVERILR